MTGTSVNVQVLGPVAASNGEGPCQLGGATQRRLLAAFAVTRSVVSADNLIERVWGNALPADPHNSLRTAMTRLRHALGDGALVTEANGWRLADHVSIDSDEFVRLVAESADAGLNLHHRLATLDEALSLWRGDAFGELAAEDWCRAEARRLEESRLTAIERRYEAMLTAGMHTDALPGLTAESGAHPMSDRLVGLRMIALFRTGRHPEATRVFQEHRRRLADELGLEPGTELVELDRRIVAGDPSLNLQSPAGRPLRGYRIGEQLGEGAFATVFRGTQPSVGRDVAVKIIRSQLANRPEFIRRFEAEAHLVARLEHPYIVPLYDYWREPDRAYLVFRYLRGGTLEQRLASTRGLPLDECVNMVEQVGSALTEAHLAGVVHRDVKPANVLLDERGNFYLGDFGIALEAATSSDPSAALSAGSPAYASPEQLRRDPVGPTADIHGLGISLYEALTGRLPFPDAANQAELLSRQLSEPIPSIRGSRSDIPSVVDDVIARATAKHPDDRYQSVDEFIADLQAATGTSRPPAPSIGGSTIVSAHDGRNPYKGLRAFTEADAFEFFGRERLVDRMTETLRQAGTPGRVLAVVGPSGIGKSSVVRAGLLPKLRDGAVPGSEDWVIATVLPGPDPFDEVAAALMRIATSVPDNLMGQLTDDHRGLSRIAKAMAPEGSDILLLIDQFEELFTLAEPTTAKRFLDAIEYALTDGRCPLRVVLTVRADFWDRPLRHGSFARLIDDSIVHVTALAPDELERAIVAPATRVGAEFEPGLVSEITADIADQPGALPLLQYALTQLWEQRVSGLLTRDAYHQLGGVAGALAGRAEEIYQDLTADERTSVWRVFARLITLGEGTDDTRRRSLRSELGVGSETDAVLEQFGSARLLTFDHDDASREPTVEVAHEALIREWPRLREWLENDRDGLRIQRHLTAASTEWQNARRPESELYRGGRLESAEVWANAHSDELTELERDFLTTSTDARLEAQRAEQEQLEHERRSNRRLRTLLASVAVVAALALIAGTVAIAQRREASNQRDAASAAASDADQQRLVAESAAEDAEEQRQLAVLAAAEADQTRFTAEVRRMVSDARELNDVDPPLAMLVAATAYTVDPTPQTLGALQDVLARTDGFLGRLATDRDFIDVRFIDSTSFVTRTELELELWDLTKGSGRSIATATNVVALDVDGSLVALLDVQGTLRLLDSQTGNELQVATAATGDRADISVSADPVRVAVSDAESVEVFDGQLERLWGTSAHAAADDVRGCDTCIAVALFDRDLFVSVGLELFRFDEAGQVVYRADPFSDDIGDLPADWQERGFVHEMVSDPANDRVWLQDPTAYVNASDGTQGGLWNSTELFQSLSLAEGQVLHGGGLIDLATGADRSLSWAGATPTAAALSPDGTTVVTAGSEGLEIWALDGRGPISTTAPTPGAIMASLDATNQVVSWTAWPSGEHGLYDISIREALTPDLGDAFMQYWLPSGSLTTWGFDGRSRVWAASTFEEISGDLPPQTWGFFLTAPDDAFAMFGEQDDRAGVITVRDILTGEPVYEAGGLLSDDPNAGVSWLHFSPDGTLAAAPRYRGSLGLFHTADWTLAREVGVDDQIRSATFSNDGATLALHTSSGQLHFLDIESGTVRDGPLAGELDTAGLMATMAYTPDDRYLLLGVTDGVEIWDVEAGQQVGSTLPNTGLRFGTTSYDGRYGITMVDDRTIVWDLDVTRWVDIACRAADRDMTEAEWEQYGLTGEPYRPVCEEAVT